ncbi:hypothetical protein [Polyangium fumosum]|uniref:DUF2085 domain-containing protein n=1 Tax=Polyangium fumosum TaxID=889272 RepID=A0A4U1JBV0_9BACT|nr:hypothetical protein [Polyangium fumosum]TKD07310.1 hypothetical protein E8A74_17815 [Polyangium fumosum]
MADRSSPRRLELAGVPPAAFALSELGRYPSFAHHPTCGRHDHHLVRPFGVPLCLGCACMYPGIAVALIALFFVSPAHDVATAFKVAMAALGCAVPTFFQPFIQRRWYKIPARFVLGVGFGLVAGAAWLLPNTLLGWAIRAAVVVATLGLGTAALRLRAKRLDDPCKSCPWGTFPVCAHNLPALRRIREQQGPDPFVDSLLAELEPLAPYPPRLGETPPVQRQGQFQFHAPPPNP